MSGRFLGSAVTAGLLAALVFSAHEREPVEREPVERHTETRGVVSVCPTPEVSGWTREQMTNAATIARVGQEEGMTRRAIVVAIATAIQESSLINYGHLGSRNDHDSLGLFQQRPSQGWGTPAQVGDPEYASRAFYRALTGVDRWEDLPLTVAAQRVQRSAFPDAYARWESDAERVTTAVTLC